MESVSDDGEDFFYTTGDAKKMKLAAKNAFDFVIENVEKVKI